MHRGCPPWSPLIVAAVVAVVTAVPPGAGAFAGGAGPARATRVVILSMTGCCAAAAWPEAEAKVAVELKMLDIKVEMVDGVSAADQQIGNRLAAALDDRDVVAALRIVRNGGGSAVVDLLYRDRQSKKAAARHTQFVFVDGKEHLAVAVLKIVELLTAGAMELSATPPPMPASEAVPPASPAARGSPVAHATLRLPPPGIGVGVGAAPAPGYVTMLPTAYIAARAAVFGGWSVEGAGSLSLPGRTIPLADAKADFYHGSLRLWALWDAVRYGALNGIVGGGGGAILIDTRGHADGARAGAGDRVLTGYAGATSRLSYALAGPLRVGLMLNIGAALPRAAVHYSPSDAKNFGWPLAEAALTADMAIR